MNPNKTELTDAELIRYSRQILLPDIDYQGQLLLSQSHAVIFGLGGLGSPVALYLAAAGIGTLTLVDFDTVDDSNLQRQIIHNEQRLGEPKVTSAKQQLQALNHHIEIRTLHQKLTDSELSELVKEADILLDCTDNFDSRYALNQACFTHKKPLVSGAAIRWEGQLTTYDFRNDAHACYQCLYKSASTQEMNCTENGVVAPLVGMIGSMQAMEAIKALLNLPTLAGKLMIIDGMTLQIRTLTLPKDPKCPTCSINGQ